MASIKLKGDTSGELTIQAPSVAGTNTLNLPASSGTLATTAQASIGMKNRIINGNMAIDQRNAGASVTPAPGDIYTIDRWEVSSNVSGKISIQQVTTSPVGFASSAKMTSTSAYTIGASELVVYKQKIEGYNISDLAWGTANAKTITISFWVRSSLTGTFGGALNNNGSTRNYAFTYTISVADTWEQKTITIPGDTTGTWLTTNGIGLSILIGLGVGTAFSGTVGSWSSSFYASATGATSVVGTSGATFYITGVQLETGTTATDFEHLQYGTQLALCERYCEVYDSNSSLGTALAYASIRTSGTLMYRQQKRAIPTITPSSLTAFKATNGAGGAITSTNVGVFSSTRDSTELQITVASGLTIGQASLNRLGAGTLTISAEL